MELFYYMIDWLHTFKYLYFGFFRLLLDRPSMHENKFNYLIVFGHDVVNFRCDSGNCCFYLLKI